MTRTKKRLTNRYVEAMHLAVTRAPYVETIWDTYVRGLSIRVGPQRSTWTFVRQHRDHGKRGTTWETLGTYPSMSVAQARKAALKIAGRIAAGRIEPSRRAAVKFETAFAEYLEYLQEKADEAKKPARWRVNVEHYGRVMLLPRFARWSLIELSRDPRAVKKWHQEMVKAHGKTSADHAAKVLRAVYRKAAEIDRTLPLQLPTSGVKIKVAASGGMRGKGMAFADFPAWAAAVARLPPLHRAFHRVNLLTGTRPGELSRLAWADIGCRTLTIRNPKMQRDITLPLSIPIVRELKIARANGPSRDLVFPKGAARWREKDDLPWAGMDLRRTYKTVVIDSGVEELISEFLMGHAPEGVSRRYILTLFLASGPAMRAAQARVSERIVELLGHSSVKP